MAASIRCFGMMKNLDNRKTKRLVGWLHVDEFPRFWVTSSRPSNFGDPLDVKNKLDDWFHDNRAWNEESKDYYLKRTKMYMFEGAFIYSLYFLMFYWAIQLVREVRARRARAKVMPYDNYMEVNLKDLKKGECKEINWYGQPIFVRRLSVKEVEETDALDSKSVVDKKAHVRLVPYKDSQIVCVKAFTEENTVPICGEGDYEGWYCPHTKQTFDKFGRCMNKGKFCHKGKNLEQMNFSIHGDMLCCEDTKQFESSYKSIFYVQL
eukprot:TRINITY_DN3147_c0_g1_i1.p2 TRINITY_DN3147_c0_g1~~TRINITY_DN3147_c0_g1_i1.p2  ORF type:complete len:282 (-),score=30.99 TRINITY_DN3147_c0_g1_i1:13-804(-)